MRIKTALLGPLAIITAALCTPTLGQKSVDRGKEANSPQVMAHYMPWFLAKPVSTDWGWHWTMNAFDPEKIVNGRWQIASRYYPLIGPYDSGDPAVIEYHLLLMKLAGIDGVIVDWYGRTDYYDYASLHRNTQALLTTAERLGMKFAVCYEDQTIPKLVEGGRIAPDERVAHARREIEWLQRNWFRSPAYLRLNDKPVLLSFGLNGLTDGEWEETLRPKRGSLLYLSQQRRRSAAAGTFDWVMPQRGLKALDDYAQSVRTGEICVPAAYPRFHDIYEEGKVHASYGYIPDDTGRTFRLTLERAWKSGASLIQIVTWNDWGEGTQIEPSVEFGYRDLEAIQRMRRQHDPLFKAAPADLRLPHRLWQMRRRQADRPNLKQELDRAARLMASGDLSGARATLDRANRLSEKRP
jgi:hypothetical protein